MADPSSDMLKLSAYGLLAQFWANIGTGEEVEEEDARQLLLLQKALVDEFDKTLQAHLDEESMKNFREYVQKFKVRIWFGEGQKASRYRPSEKSGRKTSSS